MGQAETIQMSPSRDKLLARAEMVAREEGLWTGPGYISEADCTRVRTAIQSGADEYSMRLAVETAASHAMMRAGYALMSGRADAACSLRDGWSLQLLATEFNEQGWLKHIASVNSYQDLIQRYSINSGFFWEFAHVAWAQYAARLDTQWQESAKLLKIAELRGEGRVFSKLDFGLMPWAFTEFLRQPTPSPDSLRALSSAQPFAGISDAWNDDTAFSEFVAGLADWHLQKCYRVSPYDCGHHLLPTWIFALDRCRSMHKGKSCLPGHPLLAYGTRVFDANFSGPLHPIVVEVEFEYRRRYGNIPIDFETPWRKFLARE